MRYIFESHQHNKELAVFPSLRLSLGLSRCWAWPGSHWLWIQKSKEMLVAWDMRSCGKCSTDKAFNNLKGKIPSQYLELGWLLFLLSNEIYFDQDLPILNCILNYYGINRLQMTDKLCILGFAEDLQLRITPSRDSDLLCVHLIGSDLLVAMCLNTFRIQA